MVVKTNKDLTSWVGFHKNLQEILKHVRPIRNEERYRILRYKEMGHGYAMRTVSAERKTLIQQGVKRKYVVVMASHAVYKICIKTKMRNGFVYEILYVESPTVLVLDLKAGTEEDMAKFRGHLNIVVPSEIVALELGFPEDMGVLMN